MSLIDYAMTDCVRVIESEGTAPDGMGGVLPEWSDGEAFRAALALEASAGTRRADRDEAADIYAVLVSRSVALGFHDLFRRASDGAVFRVISEGGDCRTPETSGLDLRRVRAERWELPAQGGGGDV